MSRDLQCLDSTLSIVLSCGLVATICPSLNCALTYVAQEVGGLLQQSHLAVKGTSIEKVFCLKAITTLKTVTTSLNRHPKIFRFHVSNWRTS